MWDISTGMCLMTLVSPLVFFSGSHSCTSSMKCIILHVMLSREARVAGNTVLMASVVEILLLLKNTDNLQNHSVNAVLWCRSCDE